MIDLKPVYATQIREILQKHVPDRHVLAFGSRATGKTKPYSDLDLAIIGEKPLPFSTMGALKSDFMESDLPFRVDVIDWATTAEEFRKIITRDGVRLQ